MERITDWRLVHANDNPKLDLEHTFIEILSDVIADCDDEMEASEVANALAMMVDEIILNPDADPTRLVQMIFGDAWSVKKDE